MRYEARRDSLAVILAASVVVGGWSTWKVFRNSDNASVSRGLHRAERLLMGTHWIIQVAPTNRMDSATVRLHIRKAFEEVARVESVMSEWQADSPISAVNQAAGKDPVSVPEELANLIGRAVKISELSDGAFDISWKALGKLWRFRDETFIPPSEDAIRETLASVDYRKIIVDQTHVGLAEPEMQLGLGGIAKGYGVDRACQVLHAAGINNFYVEGGGDIAVAGLKHGRPWRVAIRHPRKGPNDILAVVEVSNAAVVTSGDYESFRLFNGQRFHHILDPRTGLPSRGCRSVTVIAPSAELADAWATTVFVLGPVDGLKLVGQQPQTEAMIVDAFGHLHTTDNFKPSLVRLVGED